MDLSFNGFHQQVATFLGDVAVGDIVSLSDSGTVAKAAADEELIGVCVSKRADVVGIQLCGAVTLSYSGSAPEVGKSILVTAGNNQVKTAEAGGSHLVVAVDTTLQTCTVIL